MMPDVGARQREYNAEGLYVDGPLRATDPINRLRAEAKGRLTTFDPPRVAVTRAEHVRRCRALVAALQKAA